MEYKQGGRCYDPKTKKWRGCGQPASSTGNSNGRPVPIEDLYEGCCQDSPCCLNCPTLSSFASCFFAAIWNFPVWGWGSQNIPAPVSGSWSNAFRSFQRSGCFMFPDPQPGAPNNLPVTLYTDFPGTEACFRLLNVTNTDVPLLPGDTIVSCFQFEALEPGCADFSICVLYENTAVGLEYRAKAIDWGVCAGFPVLNDADDWINTPCTDCTT